jgi:hypothetical protein
VVSACDNNAYQLINATQSRKPKGFLNRILIIKNRILIIKRGVTSGWKKIDHETRRA